MFQRTRLKDSNVEPIGDAVCTVLKEGAEKQGGGKGWADVRKKGYFGFPFREPTDEQKVTLDEAIFAAYGWPPDLTDEEILEKLLALNLERAGQ